MVQLTEKQLQALRIAHAALVEIRVLAMAPVTPATMGAIHDLADALHNVPADVARQLEDPTLANTIGQTIDHDIEAAAGVFKRAGLSMGAFPPDVQPRDADRSHYVDSGAKLRITPEIAAQAYGGAKSRGDLGLGSSLVLLFKRILG
ncbi:hypothetical protein [Cupriavidus sp. UYPR2.512]|uniref:hypothetical protein n=1 Tax=Cupriavidus sp. UYPR2.512 TaxID=1080187 RepID=UPI00035D7047|nr:hypothetical protein [Cupriavidus sp. UYPR2.512]UIF89420.1 hypothetical protein KAF44_29560 [Cupriavidus necator]